jgi:hypothetical protein
MPCYISVQKYQLVSPFYFYDLHTARNVKDFSARHTQIRKQFSSNQACTKSTTYLPYAKKKILSHSLLSSTFLSPAMWSRMHIYSATDGPAMELSKQKCDRKHLHGSNFPAFVSLTRLWNVYAYMSTVHITIQTPNTARSERITSLLQKLIQQSLVSSGFLDTGFKRYHILSNTMFLFYRPPIFICTIRYNGQCTMYNGRCRQMTNITVLSSMLRTSLPPQIFYM